MGGGTQRDRSYVEWRRDMTGGEQGKRRKLDYIKGMNVRTGTILGDRGMNATNWADSDSRRLARIRLEKETWKSG